MKNKFLLLIFIFCQISMYPQKFINNVDTKKMHEDNKFPEYGIVSNPFDSNLKCDLNRIEYLDKNFQAWHQNHYVEEWIDKKPFFILFTNFPNGSYEFDVLSFTDGCNVYCLVLLY